MENLTNELISKLKDIKEHLVSNEDLTEEQMEVLLLKSLLEEQS